MPLYQPPAFASPPDTASTLASQHPFATLITPGGDTPWISHLVLLPDPGQPDCLLGHLAAANGHSQALLHAPSVAIFQGEHGYISPRWYHSSGMVPTWNYRVAHAHCSPAEQISGDELYTLLAQLSARFEGPDGWSPQAVPAHAMAAMQRAIVGFRLHVTQWQCKEKLSQNRSLADRRGVIAALASGGPDDQQLAACMQAALDSDSAS
ncbi:MAG: FMN-binding negative transcriptional regulator [Vogesella sp.]|uniref:FMN-binding negative transcriptional regulator n=1 Tax=Vogesella sp. TaxID=1904252 RepID=UPI003F34E902